MTIEFRYRGRKISQEDILYIRALIEQHPQESRRARFAQIARQYKRDGDAARSLFNYLNISDIPRLAVRAGTIQIDEDVIKTVKKARDDAVHASENIVADYHAVSRLAKVKRECLRILGAALNPKSPEA